jgi:hypothetical protein
MPRVGSEALIVCSLADLAYEDMLSKGLVWAGERLFEHLGLLDAADTRALLGRISDGSEQLSFEKLTSDNLRGALVNYDELMDAAMQVYAEVAAQQFEQHSVRSDAGSAG